MSHYITVIKTTLKHMHILFHMFLADDKHTTVKISAKSIYLPTLYPEMGVGRNLQLT